MSLAEHTISPFKDQNALNGDCGRKNGVVGSSVESARHSGWLGPVPGEFMSNPKWILTLERLQESRAKGWLELEAGIPKAFFDK